MATEKKNIVKEQACEHSGSKILAGALYIVTVLFVLGFFLQSIFSFFPAE
jgi:hypothetical protein